MTEQHAKVGLGGSTASRTINCPGWRKLAERCPRRGSSSFADEGTLLHEAMSLILEDKASADSVVGMKYADTVLTKELREDKIIPALRAFDECYGDMDYWVEKRVELASVPGAWGTGDVVGLRDDKSIVILDWKFGDGVIVSAEENAQLKFYAVGALHTLRNELPYDADTKVELVIIQPARGLAEISSSWTTTVRDLRTWELTFAAAVKEGDRQHPKTSMGKHCKFCPATTICPEMTKSVDIALKVSPKGLSPEATAEWLAKADQLESWIRTLRANAHHCIEEGGKLPGWKLVAKRARRRWVDVDEARTWMLKNDIPIAEIMDMKFKTPAQIEKIVKEKGKDVDRLKEFTESVSSGTVLAHVDDKRPEIKLGGLTQAAAVLAASLGK